MKQVRAASGLSISVFAVLVMLATICVVGATPRTAHASSCDASVSNEAGLIAAAACYANETDGSSTVVTLSGDVSLTATLVLNNSTTATFTIDGAGNTLSSVIDGSFAIDGIDVTAGHLVFTELEYLARAKSGVQLGANTSLTMTNTLVDATGTNVGTVLQASFDGASVSMANSAIAGTHSGAVAVAGTLLMVDSTISGFGGISAFDTSTIAITNSTLAGEQSAGIALQFDDTDSDPLTKGTATLTAVTLNKYSKGVAGSAVVSIQGSLFAETSNDACDTSNGLTITDLGGNVVPLQSCAPIVGTATLPTAGLGLGSLADNGCAASLVACPETIAIAGVDSPAIDAWSSCAATNDQRGAARAAGACDAGAYEGFDCPGLVGTEVQLELGLRCYNRDPADATRTLTVTADLVPAERLLIVDNATNAVLVIDGDGHTITTVDDEFGLRITDGDVRLEQLTLAGASADAIQVRTDADLSLLGSTITNTTETAIDGSSHTGQVHLVRSTLNGNQDGIKNVFDLVIDSSTLTGSTFRAISSATNTTEIVNSTIAENAAGLTVIGGSTTVTGTSFVGHTGFAISMFTFGATGVITITDSMSFNNGGACASSMNETLTDGTPRTTDGGGNAMAGSCGPIAGITEPAPVGTWFGQLPALAQNPCAVGVNCTMTVAIPPGFPTAGAGRACSLAADQRGVGRPNERCDAGSFELPNQAPVAVADGLPNLAEDAAPLEIDGLVNDSDPDNDPLVITGVSNLTAGAGAVTVDGDQLGVTYVPTLNFNGLVAFDYGISDGSGGTDAATVSFRVTPVDDPPVAVDDELTVAGNVSGQSGGTTEDLLANDIEVDGDVLRLFNIGPVDPIGAGFVNGTSFVPAPEFVGQATFTYMIEDGETANRLSDTATVTVTVTDVNDPPQANDDITPGFVLNEDDPATVLDVLANDTDPDPGDVLVVLSAEQPERGGSTQVVNGELVFTPQAGFAGFAGRLMYTVSDGNGGTDTAEIAVQINEVNDPPIVVDDSIEVLENGFVRFQPWRNDTDPEGKQLKVNSVTQPPSGEGTATVVSNSFVDFEPAADFAGMTSFTYEVADPDGGTAVGTIFVNVIAVNEAPTANLDTGNGIQNGDPVVIDVVANDTDPDGDQLTVVSVTNPSNGTAEIVENKVVYTGDVDFFGSDLFSYTVSDGQGETADAEVHIFLEDTTPRTRALDDEFDVTPGVLNQLDVLANDIDGQGLGLTITAVTSPFPTTSGTAQISADGKTIVMSAFPGFTGQARVFYNIIDSTGETDGAFAFMNATAATLCAGLPVTIDLSANGGNGAGTAGDDVILGTPGDDVIDGGDGDDTICAGAGDDQVVGGNGNDTMFGEGGRDIIRGNPGDDTIDGGDGNDRLLGGIGDDTISGGDGDDFIGGFGGNDIIDGGDGDETIFGGFGADTIDGGDGADFISGLIGNDVIDGGPGDDELNGDRGNDTINGGPGNDIIRGGNANDILNGGSGDDSVSGGKADDAMTGGLGVDVCVGNLQTIADTADATCETVFGVP